MSIYTYCAFETAWEKHKVSPWCLIFDKLDLMVIFFMKYKNVLLFSS